MPGVLRVLLEQFIRAKYEREEFVEPSRQTGYMASSKTGHLFKRHRDAAKFEIRRFELSEASNTLSYYVKEVRSTRLEEALTGCPAVCPVRDGRQAGRWSSRR